MTQQNQSHFINYNIQRFSSSSSLECQLFLPSSLNCPHFLIAFNLEQTLASQIFQPKPKCYPNRLWILSDTLILRWPSVHHTVGPPGHAVEFHLFSYRCIPVHHWLKSVDTFLKMQIIPPAFRVECFLNFLYTCILIYMYIFNSTHFLTLECLLASLQLFSA